MSPLGFFRSVLASSRHRIRGLQAIQSSGLLHRLPHGRRHATAAATALVGAAGSASLYLNQDAEKSAGANHSPKEEEAMEEKAMRMRFEEWMVEHGRAYRDEEEKATRYEVFSRTARFVDEQNARPGRLSSCGTNKFADMTQEEFSRCHGGVRVTEDELAGLRRDRGRRR